MPQHRRRRDRRNRPAADSHEFKPLLAEIEEEPRHPLGPVIFWLVIATILFFGFWMCIGRVDVVVTARGRFIPVGEVKVLQPLTTGVVKKILVTEGELVEQGQALVEIDPTGTESDLESMRADFTQLSLEIERLRASLDNAPFNPDPERHDTAVIEVQRQLYLSNRERLAQQLQMKEEELRKAGEQRAALRKNTARSLYMLDISSDKATRLATVRDIVSRDELSQAESEVKKYETEIRLAGHQESALLAEEQRIGKEMRILREENRGALLAELSEKRQKYLHLQSSMEKTAYVNARQQITAPTRGYVNKLFIHTEGGGVTPAERLITLVPADSPLVARVLIENKDIGFVEPGMDAAIKVDTFSFQKYGTLEGRVEQMGKDSLDDERLGLVYEAYVRPRKISIPVEGVDTPIRAGMSVTTEFKVGRRRIIEFFVYPLVKYLDEGMSVR